MHPVAQAFVELNFDFNRDGHVDNCDIDHLISDLLDNVYGDGWIGSLVNVTWSLYFKCVRV